MKKILTHLTGIVFLIGLLAAGGCHHPDKEKENSADTGIDPKMKASVANMKEVDVYLRDSFVNDVMHLYIYDDRSPGCGVLDDHFLVVKRGTTINWKKDSVSNIDEIVEIKPVGEKLDFFGALPEFVTGEAEDTEEFNAEGGESGIYRIKIPEELLNKIDTVIKYEIHFTIDEPKDTTYVIDPYLKIPKEADQ